MAMKALPRDGNERLEIVFESAPRDDGSDAPTMFVKKFRALAPTRGVVCAVLCCTALAVSIGIWKLMEHEESRSGDARLVVHNIGEKYAQDIARQLKSSVSAIYALAAFAKVDEYAVLERNFDKIASALIAGYSGITNVQLAPGGIVRRIYPMTPADTAAIGHNLLLDPARRNLTVATILGQRVRIDGPRPLLQGGWGLLARYPIFTTSAPEFTPDEPFRLGNVTYTARCTTMEQLMANCHFAGPDDGQNKTYFFAFVRATPCAHPGAFGPTGAHLAFA